MSKSTVHQQFVCNAKNISHQFEDKALFDSLCFSLPRGITGLIGANGVGKSSLAKILSGDLPPSSGMVETTGRLHYVTQEDLSTSLLTIAQYLDIDKILQAIALIEQGDINPAYLDLVANHWEIEDEISTLFERWRLPKLDLTQAVSTLSGGEQTKLKLIKLEYLDIDYLILDEPTNNLDIPSKEIVTQWIQSSKQSMLIISHDRQLLSLVEHIFELTNQSIKSYGGNFNYYQQEKSTQVAAQRAKLIGTQLELKRTTKQKQINKEIAQKRSQFGKKRKKDEIKARGYASRAGYDFMQNRAEKSTGKLHIKDDKKQKALNDKIKTLRSDIERLEQIELKVTPIEIPSNKIMLEANDLTFGFNGPLVENLNFSLRGPFRIQLRGKNGSGKSTLIRLVQNQLQPLSGNIQCNTNSVQIVDQHAKELDHNLSVFDNFMALNPQCSAQFAYNQLAVFLFKDQLDIPVTSLSGGERVRLNLACRLLSYNPPELLILDEPTNHMDLQSIECIEQALIQYSGALLVISHDQKFVQNINILEYIFF